MTRTRSAALAVALAGLVLLIVGGRMAGSAPRVAAADLRAEEDEAVRPAREEPVAPAPTAPQPVAAVLPLPPAALALPEQGMRAPVVPVGVLPSGALQLPERPATVGWWAAGALPGAATGTVVVAGHLDSAEYGAGAFEALLHVEVDDVVELTDSGGALHRYRVTARDSYDKRSLPPELFTAQGPPRLALVTCGGTFDERTGHYSENVVVTALPA